MPIGLTCDRKTTKGNILCFINRSPKFLFGQENSNYVPYTQKLSRDENVAMDISLAKVAWFSGNNFQAFVKLKL